MAINEYLQTMLYLYLNFLEAYMSLLRCTWLGSLQLEGARGRLTLVRYNHRVLREQFRETSQKQSNTLNLN